jgi:ATP-dependent RNA helicase MSS116, mitochondrial
LAYLLPAIQRLLETDAKFFRPGRTIGLVVLAPTRELVIQIAQQASKLVTYHHAWTVQAFHGGGSIQKDRAVLYHRPLPTILVATPGRLYDLIREPCRVSGNRFFATVMGECRIVVLDEADQLLQGLSWEMNKLWSCIPRVEKRQTMLFSATISAKLEAILTSGNRTNILPLDFVTIDYEQKVDRSVEGPRVEEHCLQLRSMSQYVSGLFSLINHVMTNKSIHPKYKVLVFLPTAKLVNFFADLLAAASIPVLSIHSRMSQGSRQRASQSFHQSTARCVMLSSDISARGLDYPDVDLVVQVRIILLFESFSIWPTHKYVCRVSTALHSAMTCICIVLGGQVALGRWVVVCWYSSPLKVHPDGNT